MPKYAKITKDRRDQIKNRVAFLGALEWDDLTTEEQMLIDAWTLMVRAEHHLALTKARAHDLLTDIEHMRLRFRVGFESQLPDPPEDLDETIEIPADALQRTFARRAHP